MRYRRFNCASWRFAGWSCLGAITSNQRPSASVRDSLSGVIPTGLITSVAHPAGNGTLGPDVPPSAPRTAVPTETSSSARHEDVCVYAGVYVAEQVGVLVVVERQVLSPAFHCHVPSRTLFTLSADFGRIPPSQPASHPPLRRYLQMSRDSDTSVLSSNVCPSRRFAYGRNAACRKGLGCGCRNAGTCIGAVAASRLG